MPTIPAPFRGSAWRPQEIACPVGTLIGGLCPGTAPPEIAARLHPEERRFAEDRSGDPLRQWIAGRYCVAQALRAHGLAFPVLPGTNGRPSVPAGVSASISHKHSVSVAIVTTVFDGIGLDIEYIEEGDRALAEKVLTSSERDGIQRTTELSAAIVAVHFALKEAVYKAAPDREQHDLEFKDIVIASAEALLSQGSWVSFSTRVQRSPSEYRAHAYRLGPWVLAVATRS